MKIVFINQMAGPLFMELAEDLSERIPSSIITGHSDALKRSQKILRVIKAPAYNRKNLLCRVLSWIHYFIFVIIQLLKRDKKEFIFIVSNPPFLGLVGLLFNIFRKQKYVLLIYDLYPEILFGMGIIKKGLLYFLWNKFNESINNRAVKIFTIGNDIAAKIAAKKNDQKVIVIPCWADTTVIRPLVKRENSFANEHQLCNKTVVLYSGNMGYSHNIKDLIEAARINRNKSVHFLFIGSGAQKVLVNKAVLENPNGITILPFQPETVLPLSIACGDIGVASYQLGTEGCMVPSKAYYYIAAGLCLIVLSEKPTELSAMVEEYKCGIWIKSGNHENLLKSITMLTNSKDLLEQYRFNARSTAEKYFSRSNTSQFTDNILLL